MTIRDIARKCRVGVSTVSRAMNNHPDINPETKEMILRVIEESGYIPNNSARNLKITESDTVAILVKGISNPFFSGMIDMIQKKAQQHDYACILQHVESYENELDKALVMVQEKKLKGIVFLGGNFRHRKEKLQKLGVPFVVSTAGRAEEFGVPMAAAVSVDDFAESYKLVDYLCRLGHKKIATLTSADTDQSVGRLRFEGYLKALKDNGIEPDEKLIFKLRGDCDHFSITSGYELTRKALTEHRGFTALYAIADTLAVGACRALCEAGVRIPADCAVAGYDGLEIGKYYIPSITTIRQPVEEIARETAKLLFEMILDRKEPESRTFPGELVVGESTGPAEQEDDYGTKITGNR